MNLVYDPFSESSCSKKTRTLEAYFLMSLLSVSISPRLAQSRTEPLRISMASTLIALIPNITFFINQTIERLMGGSIAQGSNTNALDLMVIDDFLNPTRRNGFLNEVTNKACS
jgi:hypothetical protein